MKKKTWLKPSILELRNTSVRSAPGSAPQTVEYIKLCQTNVLTTYDICTLFTQYCALGSGQYTTTNTAACS